MVHFFLNLILFILKFQTINQVHKGFENKTGIFESRFSDLLVIFFQNLLGI
jgi:hypothetical protein